MLYGFLLDRASLSWVSGERWRTEQGDPFVIFTLEEIQKRLQCGEKKASQCLKSLVEHHLVTLSRPKKDGPYHIVVLPFDQSKVRLDTRQNDTCAAVEIAAAHPSKLRLNNTDINNTDKNNTEKITLWEREIKTHIQYDYLISDYPKNLVDTLVEVMVQTMVSSAKTVTVGGVPMDSAIVRDYVEKAGILRIQYIFDHMDTLEEPVRAYRPYFLARLCDPEGAVDAFYETLQKQYSAYCFM